MMREKEMKLEPLKVRYHGVSGRAMPYDERYTPYIQQAGLLPWIQLVSRSTPNLNAPLVSSLADRWRPETHSFHLQTREMTVTLEDVALITGLPIDGKPLYTCSCLYVVRCLEDFVPDSTGKNAPWMWLKALTVFDSGWSWGSANLAYLYRQLDDVCCRITDSAGIGGNMLLLSFGLFQPHPPEWVDTDKALHRLDRRRQRKVKDWDKHHASYVTRFHLCVEEARSSARAQLREHNSLAFDNYMRWLLENTRVDICPPAYNEDILEEHRNEIKKAADESQSILEKTPVGEGNDDGSLRAFLKGHELDDDTTLADAQVWSAYMFKPRQPIRRYTPTDFDNRGNPKVVVGTSRMASLDDEADEEVEEEEAHPNRKKKKIACRRGTRNTRGKH
ncbi:uncharacterized protein [Aegilops tauschii subsp. strangulata]|uniref:uncharacterized protein n=1 Tax=Aegilops tauschii subsp. strangulata TaxID=200361 RepID=UPI001ABC1EEA|nr:uncharacterized protein LOC109780180 [Aegilops tauschii subsp. strangulata]